MIYGYCRISTGKQNIDRQVRNIRQVYPDAVILQEQYTGTVFTSRTEWNKLIAAVKSGDSIVFDSVSRMSRNAEEGYEAYERLFNRGIDLVFLKEPHINTATFKGVLERSIPLTGTNVDFILEGVNRYLMALAKEQIRLAFEQAEKEVSDLHQRTREGIETARLNGKQIGRKAGRSVVTKKSLQAKKLIEKYAQTFGGPLSDKEVIKLSGVSRNSYYKYKRELESAAKK